MFFSSDAVSVKVVSMVGACLSHGPTEDLLLKNVFEYHSLSVYVYIKINRL